MLASWSYNLSFGTNDLCLQYDRFLWDFGVNGLVRQLRQAPPTFVVSHRQPELDPEVPS